MSRNRAARQSEDGGFVCVKWCKDNKYPTLSVSKLPDDVIGLKGEALIGNVCQIKWSDGRVYAGEVVGIGSKDEMLLEEEKLERQAVDISMEIREDGENPVSSGSVFALVHWREDGKLSVVSRSKLKISGNWEIGESLEGRNAEGKWKGSWLPVTVIAIGSKADMKAQLRSRVTEGISTRKSRNEESGGLDNDDEEAGSPLAALIDEEEADDKDIVIAKLKEDLAECKRKLALEEARSKKFRRMLNKAQEKQTNTDESGMVDIGGGLSVPKSVDDYVNLSYPNKPMKFLKNLLVKGGIFTLEELASHSLKGGKSPKVPNEARDMLDPTKLKAAVDYTVSCLRLKEDPVSLGKFENNMKDLCTNARKELKNLTK